jgi:hypothetical protein
LVRSAAGLTLTLLASGCLYGFSGGGLPSHVRTVAVIPFDNRTGEPALTQEVFEAVRVASEGRLGLRPAAESNADAVVRGEIVRYEPDVPLSYLGGNQQEQVAVTRRQVQIVVNVEIVDQRQGRTLWRQQGLMVNGEYEPTQGGESEGRRIALQKLVTSLVEGAQSQW